MKLNLDQFHLKVTHGPSGQCHASKGKLDPCSSCPSAHLLSARGMQGLMDINTNAGTQAEIPRLREEKPKEHGYSLNSTHSHPEH